MPLLATAYLLFLTILMGTIVAWAPHSLHSDWLRIGAVGLLVVVGALADAPLLMSVPLSVFLATSISVGHLLGTQAHRQVSYFSLEMLLAEAATEMIASTLLLPIRLFVCTLGRPRVGMANNKLTLANLFSSMTIVGLTLASTKAFLMVAYTRTDAPLFWTRNEFLVLHLIEFLQWGFLYGLSLGPLLLLLGQRRPHRILGACFLAAGVVAALLKVGLPVSLVYKGPLVALSCVSEIAIPALGAALILHAAGYRLRR